MTAASLPYPVEWVVFEGPLDFLLEEVRRQEVDIERVQMASLVAQYLDYIRTAHDRNLNLDIEWLHTASQLILWKSRSLLPHDPVALPVPDAIRDELVEALRRHREQMTQELATRLAGEQTRLPQGSREPFTAERRAEGQEEPEDLPFVSAWDLLNQARDLARWCGQHREDVRRWRETLEVDREPVTVEEMAEWLRARLQLGETGVAVEGTGLLEEQETAGRRACLFLGMLELVRAGEISLFQAEAWGEIWIWIA